MRYFLNLSYRGTNYHGWQIQKNAVSVQQVINNAMGVILKKPIETVGSGRTDTGVHANQQVLHFDIDNKLEKADFIYKLNSLLPKDIAINNMTEVKLDAHARFSAIRRQYVYHITRRKNPFLQDQAYYFRKPLDIELMNDLEDFFIQWKDFQSFSKVKTEVNNFICDVYDIRWTCDKNDIILKITANRFLRGMVRAIVGTMLDVGIGNSSKQNFIDIVQSKDRKQAGSAVPPHGLFLNSVSYPDNIYVDPLGGVIE